MKRPMPIREGEVRRDYVKDRLSGKSAKEGVNYRQQQDLTSKKSCAECENYESPGFPKSSCSKVSGIVKHSDICDLYKARKTDPTVNVPAVSITIEIGKV